MNYSSYLLTADDVKIFRSINSFDDCVLLQCDIECIQGLCTANFMKFNSCKTSVITFTGRKNILCFTYKLWTLL